MIAEYDRANAISHAEGRFFHCRHAPTAPYSANHANSAPVVSWNNSRVTRQSVRMVTRAEFQNARTTFAAMDRF